MQVFFAFNAQAHLVLDFQMAADGERCRRGWRKSRIIVRAFQADVGAMLGRFLIHHHPARPKPFMDDLKPMHQLGSSIKQVHALRSFPQLAHLYPVTRAPPQVGHNTGYTVSEPQEHGPKLDFNGCVLMV